MVSVEPPRGWWGVKCITGCGQCAGMEKGLRGFKSGKSRGRWQLLDTINASKTFEMNMWGSVGCSNKFDLTKQTRSHLHHRHQFHDKLVQHNHICEDVAQADFLVDLLSFPTCNFFALETACLAPKI